MSEVAWAWGDTQHLPSRTARIRGSRALTGAAAAWMALIAVGLVGLATPALGIFNCDPATNRLNNRNVRVCRADAILLEAAVSPPGGPLIEFVCESIRSPYAIKFRNCGNLSAVQAAVGPPAVMDCFLQFVRLINCAGLAELNELVASGTARPTTTPTLPPVTPPPTRVPTRLPTRPITRAPTRLPTRTPTRVPTRIPTRVPTDAPTTAGPTNPQTGTPVASSSPTRAPTVGPTLVQTGTPVVTTRAPTRPPTALPSPSQPTALLAPTGGPTNTAPTTAPTSTVTPAASSGGGGGGSIGLIVGVLVVLVCLSLLIAFVVVQRRRNANGSRAPSGGRGGAARPGKALSTGAPPQFANRKSDSKSDSKTSTAAKKADNGRGAVSMNPVYAGGPGFRGSRGTVTQPPSRGVGKQTAAPTVYAQFDNGPTPAGNDDYLAPVTLNSEYEAPVHGGRRGTQWTEPAGRGKRDPKAKPGPSTAHAPAIYASAVSGGAGVAGGTDDYLAPVTLNAQYGAPRTATLRGGGTVTLGDDNYVAAGVGEGSVYAAPAPAIPARGKGPGSKPRGRADVSETRA